MLAAIMRFLVSIEGINEEGLSDVLSQIFPVQVSTDANKKMYKLAQTVGTIFQDLDSVTNLMYRVS